MPSWKQICAKTHRAWAAIGHNADQITALLTALGTLLTLLTAIIGSRYHPPGS
jgi:hypothetical protein